jgi:hypothetical protein
LKELTIVANNEQRQVVARRSPGLGESFNSQAKP